LRSRLLNRRLLRRLFAFFGGLRQRTSTGGSIGADGRQATFRREGQCEKFIGDPENQFDPVRHPEFVVQTLAVCVDSVWRKAEILGDGEFGSVIENFADNLKFAS